MNIADWLLLTGIVLAGALLSAFLCAWFANNKNSQNEKSINDLEKTLRATLLETERALGTKFDEALDRSLNIVTEGTKTQTKQIETFRNEIKGEIGNLGSSMIKLSMELPAALETAAARAKADATIASKILTDELAASFRLLATDQGVKIADLIAKVDTSAIMVSAAIDTFRNEMKSDVAAQASAITTLRAEVPALLDTAAARAKVDAAEASKVLLSELATAFRLHGIDQGAKIDAFGEKVEVSGKSVAEQLTEFKVTLTESLGDVRTTIVRLGGEMTTTLIDNQGKITKFLTEDLAKLSGQVDTKITEMRAGNEAKLLEIQGVVDAKLQEGIEKRMTESFAKITSQFAEVQQAVGEVKSVAGQVGDLKKLFSNVKSRGGWGEAQVKAALDDILPPNSYEINKCVNPATSDTVEYALKMPTGGSSPIYLSIDAKFPVEDYGRLLDAIDIADMPAERAARAALENKIRFEAKKIQSKYIAPPHTVEWAVLYLSTEGLYAEVMRNGELMEAISRDHRVVIMGPSMLSVMLRTIQLGHYSLAVGQKADVIGQILGAVKHEMIDFGNQFRLLEKNVQTIGNNIKRGRTRANVITRKLKEVVALEGPAAAEILELTADDDDVAGDDEMELDSGL